MRHREIRDQYQVNGDEFEKMLEFLNRRNEPGAGGSASVPMSRGERYEEVRRNLIRKFMRWGCDEPETLADETFNRIAKRLPLTFGADDDPDRFVHRVAYFVSLESFRRRPLPLPPKSEGPLDEEDSQAYECLELCLNRLTPASRAAILEYYQNERSSKIRGRRLIAEKLGIGLNALRIRACRIRATLQKCVLRCLEEKGDDER